MASSDAAELAVELGTALIDAIFAGKPLARVKELAKDAPLWFQAPESGWSALHAAAFREDAELIKFLLIHGAVWNAVDALGNTAADIALSLNNAECYALVRDAGIRTEILLRVLADKAEADVDMTGDDDKASEIVGDSGAIRIKAQDSTAAGSTGTFLDSKLVFKTDERGQEICVVQAGEDEVGVMMGWETNIMKRTVDALCLDHAELEDPGLRVLNIGHGLGIVDTYFQSLSTKPIQHVIVEPHPDVLAHMKAKGWYDKPGVTILEGKWQDFVDTKLLEDGGFDVVYTDTFSEDYAQLYKFFQQVPNLLRSSTSRFGFFHGLGATNATFYDVYTRVSELHLEDVGLAVEWTDVDVNIDPETWGETRKYFSLPIYRMPVASWPAYDAMET